MRDHLRFIFNGEQQKLADVAPHTTVLRWLRESKLATGTKEGCAEGDCGACTVVVAELIDGEVRYRAVNSCITLLAGMDGKALITVENLSKKAQSAHPAQRAMAENHGSQCGFCTPGFVMSMYAHLQSDNPPSARDTLAGNLCRCTGYGPILDAFAAVDTEESRAHTGFSDQQLLKQLTELHNEDDLTLHSELGSFLSPGSSQSLGQIMLEKPDAQIVAGATDVGLWITKQGQQFETLVALNRVSDLRYVRKNSGWLEIGAAATYSDAQPALTAWHPSLADLIRRIGSTQIRNNGTVVGNIANGSPIGDMPPALIALGATLVISHGDESREIRLQDYFIDYGRQDIRAGEYLRSIRIPPLAHSELFSCYKISKRFEQDISAVSAGFCVDISPIGNVVNMRACYGGMAATPKRAVAVENALMGNPWTPEAVQLAVKELERDFRPLSDWRASANYRLQVAKNLLIKFAIESQGESLNLFHTEVVADEAASNEAQS